jgi:deazaflavin-dependent oxidoreductase (nitroreductase family)
VSERFIVWISTNPVATWLIKHVASRLDPLIFKATNGRMTSMGPPAMPMLTLTATGRRSGEPRSVHLACLEQEGDYLVVASAMGQERHPAWRYNIEANPDVEVQVSGERFAARAQMLSDSEKQAVWADVRQAIPQMNVYETRTDRNIRVFRLSRADG